MDMVSENAFYDREGERFSKVNTKLDPLGHKIISKNSGQGL